MNQTASHSQMPEFGINKSQTSAILYQEPTYKEIHGKTANIFANFCAFLLIVITVLALSYMYQRSSEKEIQLQEEESLARQNQNSGVNR